MDFSTQHFNAFTDGWQVNLQRIVCCQIIINLKPIAIVFYGHISLVILDIKMNDNTGGMTLFPSNMDQGLDNTENSYFFVCG